ncbi:MAG: hypothetical protein DRN00_02895 [Thermoplasmata archaeon]|nr:MAG: hypothetical protein DRN00_02895 [Thermoplasmata archaeon]
MAEGRRRRENTRKEERRPLIRSPPFHENIHDPWYLVSSLSSMAFFTFITFSPSLIVIGRIIPLIFNLEHA